MKPANKVGVIICAALGVFAAIVVAVQTGFAAKFDEATLMSFRVADNVNDPLGPHWFEEAVADITALGGYPILLLFTFGLLISLLLHRKKAEALFLSLNVALGSLTSSGLKLLFARPRPNLVDHLDRTFTNSFPSAHAMMSAVVWISIAIIVARMVSQSSSRNLVWAFAIATILLVGISRVYLGVHWPTDIIAGWAMGIAWVGICWLLANRLQH